MSDGAGEPEYSHILHPLSLTLISSYVLKLVSPPLETQAKLVHSGGVRFY